MEVKGGNSALALNVKLKLSVLRYLLVVFEGFLGVNSLRLIKVIGIRSPRAFGAVKMPPT
jgi:hypothetical protein